MKFLDRLSPEARAIGAVNTIVNRSGKLIGYNTDVYGAMEALKSQKLKVKGQNYKSKLKSNKFLGNKNIIVLGAGGAARAIVYGLKKAGAKVTILNRTLAHAKRLARDFACGYGKPEDFKKLQCDILINATSVGMSPASALPPSLKLRRTSRASAGKPKSRATPLPNFHNIMLRQAQHDTKKPVVMDIVYRPRITKLLNDAKRAGCKIITGDRMFLSQAKKSFELWTGRRPTFSRTPLL